MVTGCADSTRVPSPIRAREFHIAKGSQRGVGLVLTFANSASATAWLTALRGQLVQCPRQPEQGTPGVTVVSNRSTTWLGRRNYGQGQLWAEVIVVSGNQVRLWIMQDPASSISPAQLQAIAAQVRA